MVLAFVSPFRLNNTRFRKVLTRQCWSLPKACRLAVRGRRVCAHGHRAMYRRLDRLVTNRRWNCHCRIYLRQGGWRSQDSGRNRVCPCHCVQNLEGGHSICLHCRAGKTNNYPLCRGTQVLRHRTYLLQGGICCFRLGLSPSSRFTVIVGFPRPRDFDFNSFSSAVDGCGILRPTWLSLRRLMR